MKECIKKEHGKERPARENKLSAEKETRGGRGGKEGRKGKRWRRKEEEEEEDQARHVDLRTAAEDRRAVLIEHRLTADALGPESVLHHILPLTP